jgi:DNA-binding PadR family transcriptional regulator
MNLSPTAKVVLGMIALGERTGYDIKRTVEHSPPSSGARATARSIPSSKRLERAGLVKGTGVKPAARARREYTVTGQRAAGPHRVASADAPLAFNTLTRGC